MTPFDLQSHLNDVYATYPEATRQPVIGITANFNDGDACLRDRYYKQIVAAHGTPVIIPPVSDKNVIINILDNIDGLLLSGGSDYNPLWAGEEPSPHLHGINASRDLAELMTVRLAYNRQIPILGICRGIQTLAMALDGKVRQDIYTQNAAGSNAAPLIKHSQDADRNEPTHSVELKKDSILYSIYNDTKIYVNSFHHQAVCDAGNRFRVTAVAPDGVIEAMESNEYKPIMGVQWHPEWLETEGLKLFDWLVKQASNFHIAKQLHKRVLTLDTHCDTPMFFPQGIHFDKRDSRILVDLHKMTDGRQDAVIMAAYLPQPKLGESFSSKVAFPVDSPTAYADLIFDKIETIVRDNSSYISMARTPADLYEDKRNGRKSIMLGIENGLALNHEITNVKHFAQRGVVYITLCHNGDNDICDSARGCNTNNGVSMFGEKVIKEMNRWGLMVDLSHGGEKSFYDALDISSTPIVCSHSNSKALCDVPRNLTDDQMRALAAKGGVAHITLYHGFLRSQGEASIMDAMSHLEHAIQIMGIDHVGLGTDFDGDGGVKGIADSSELINFTLQLLHRKYSERDIEKIWGGNWLRVMGLVQRSKEI
jgi:membrane dipeptidase